MKTNIYIAAAVVVCMFAATANACRSFRGKERTTGMMLVIQALAGSTYNINGIDYVLDGKSHTVQVAGSQSTISYTGRCEEHGYFLHKSWSNSKSKITTVDLVHFYNGPGSHFSGDREAALESHVTVEDQAGATSKLITERYVREVKR